MSEAQGDETKRGDHDDDPLLMATSAPHDYKEEPLNRGPGPLGRAPRSYPRGSPSSGLSRGS